MKKWLFIALLMPAFYFANGQTTEDYAVEITASVQTTPPSITLNWKRLSDSPTYYIYKKAKTDATWTSLVATLTYTDSTVTDTAVAVDSAYEYYIISVGTSWNATGYIYAGIKNPAIHNKGILVLLVDSMFIDSCSVGISNLMNDLSGDGWQIIKHDVSRNLPDTNVKAIIVSDYSAHSDMKAILLLGHIAVPYSGDLNPPPDGHVPQHQGAWPADVYYSCITGPWTDVYFTDTLASYNANWNVPGDGKWDQGTIGTPSNFQISRIDFNNMPAFGRTEVQMMNSYLTRDHAYKMDTLNICRRAIVSDNFGAFSGEAFAANAWRNFPPLLSRDSIQSNTFFPSLADSSFQWAYGCGGGWFTGAGGVCATADFAANPVNGIFMLLFGSYFGDWNVQDNFLRAPLCAPTPALTNCWAGRPNWFFHHMALGENIGYSEKLVQNNSASGTGAVYGPANYGAKWIHIALMGDLSLRTHYIQQPTNLSITTGYHLGANLSWVSSPDSSVLGYYVYRSDSMFGYFQRISGLLSSTSFHDSVGTDGLKFYMVRPSKLQNTPSGAYYNLGIGITDTATISYLPLYAEQKQVENNYEINIFPNPAKNYLNINIKTSLSANVTLYVVNSVGQRFYAVNKQLKSGENNYSLNVSQLAPGNYQIVIEGNDRKVSTKWVKL